jgi:putative endopeptidase
MPSFFHNRFRHACFAFAVGAAFLLNSQVSMGSQAEKGAAQGSESNFGFPVGFSVNKMDLKANPQKDFCRYAAGRWIDAAQIPGDQLMMSGFELLNKQVENQLKAILDDASRTSETAARYSSLQQVGDFYASGMDVKRLTRLGVSPLRPELDRIAGIKNPKEIPAVLAHFLEITNDPVLIGILVSSDTQDRGQYALYAADGDLTLDQNYYLNAEAAPIREAYLKLVADYLVLAGSTPDEAKGIALKILEIETRIARKKLTPVESFDPARRFVKMPFAEFRSLLSNVDLDAYMKTLGLSPQDKIIVMEVESLRERNRMLAEYPVSDTKNYLRWELLRRTSSYLSPAFYDVSMAFKRVIYGKIDDSPRTKLVAGNTAQMLGHPLSQLYVNKHFPPETKRAVEELIGRIKTEFRSRLQRNNWLTAGTRSYALEKLDKLVIRVGYPSEWIDYNGVDIRRDDYLGNYFRLNTFNTRRDIAYLGKPVKNDAFSMPGKTLPIDINAAYKPGENNIEIPAAFLQPPFYDVKADAAVNFGTIGAVIGHEMTHGFDSQGRLFDAEGNLRNWWTDADSRNFTTKTQKLIDQADAYEVIPGVRINGKLTIGENLADLGGVTFGYSAFEAYLKEHPEANRKIDGLTPEQRYYIAWAQLWASKTNEGYLRQVTARDPHPQGLYRMFAPLQHAESFFEAFGIRAGDPMWLSEQNRVAIW